MGDVGRLSMDVGPDDVVEIAGGIKVSLEKRSGQKTRMTIEAPKEISIAKRVAGRYPSS